VKKYRQMAACLLVAVGTIIIPHNGNAQTLRITPESDSFIRCIIGECRNTDYSESDSGFEDKV